MLEETVQRQIIRVNGSEARLLQDNVVQETPLTIYFNEEELVTMLCSPSQPEELAIGFLLAEGFISQPEDLEEISYDKRKSIIWVTGKKRPLQSQLMSKRYLSACCGKSRTSFYFANDAQLARPLNSDLKIPLSHIYRYTHYLETHLPLFQNTGGVHSGAIGRNGEVIYSAYDIGRHNVFDKLYGHAFQTGQSLAECVLFFSGRVSSEILLKVAKMGSPILIARSAPTELALQLAQDLHITVVGFARGDRFNIYTYPERITFPAGPAVPALTVPIPQECSRL